jgi:hypothetical protein
MTPTLTAMRSRATVQAGGTLLVTDVPVATGDEVEIIVLYPTPGPARDGQRYPLRGLPLTYEHPFKPAIDPDDWEMNG